MHWKDKVENNIFIAASYEPPSEVALGDFGFDEACYFGDFLIIDKYSLVLNVFEKYRMASVKDELHITDLHFVHADKLMVGHWSKVGDSAPKFSTKVIYDGLQLENRVDRSIGYIVDFFRKDSEIFAVAFSAGQRNGRCS